jgi:SsrA-binding protein
MSSAPQPKEKPASDRVVVTNRKARHEYEILESLEAGIALVGPEVKSLRDGKVHLTDSYASIENDEAFLHNMHVSPYEKARENAAATRTRKLLLHKTQIHKLRAKLDQAGMTLVPLRVYFTRGIAKVELGLARGKKTYDKRQAIAKREAARDVARAVRGETRGRAR